MHLISSADIARALGVSRAAVSNWRRRHSDTFPQAVEHDGRSLFRAEEIATWLKAHGFGTSGSFSRWLQKAPSDEGSRSGSEREARDPEVQQVTVRLARLLKSPGFRALADTPAVLVELLAKRIRDPAAWGTLTQHAASRPIDAIAPFLETHGVVPSTLKHEAASISRLLAGLDDLPSPQSDAEWAELTDLLLEMLSDHAPRSTGEFYTPRSVVDLMVSIARIKTGELVFDPSCGAGSLLVGAAEVAGDQIRGNTPWNESAAAARAMLGLRGIAADITENRAFEAAPLRASVILSNPPFGRRLSNPRDSFFGRIPAGHADFAWLCDAYEKLDIGGRAAILMPNGTTFRRGAERHLRAAMVESGAVERVVALPAGLFAPYTEIPVTLWVLRRDATTRNVVMVDGAELGHRTDGTRRTLSEDDIALLLSTAPQGRVKVVSPEEIQQNDYDLTPAKYIAREVTPVDDTLSERVDALERAERSARLADARVRMQLKRSDRERAVRGAFPPEWPRVPLREVVDIQAGPSKLAVSLLPLGERGVPVLSPGEISWFSVAPQAARALTPQSAAELHRYRVRTGDLVCVRTGDLGRAAAVGVEQDGWVLGTSCLRLRLIRPISSGYLLRYLAHPETRSWIRAHAPFSAIPSLSTRVLGDLPFVVAPDDVQSLVSDVLGSIEDKITAHREIIAESERLHAWLLPYLMAGRSIDDA
ncbi:N-6 DNA methylase [Nonomuraea sp. NPDC059023]|uniref:N-6 DNA methylase n=1 Tax=unclassified Nonomuraea TaxID=2593643 RepID=UPI0036972CE4